MIVSRVNFTARNPLGARTEDEMREKLFKAADDAKLNVTERLALNDEFFPQGGGFELFPEDYREHHINNFITESNTSDEFIPHDGFSIEVEELQYPEHASVVKNHYFRTKKSNFQANLDNAIKKLKSVLNPGDNK